ncbi:MAG TPA: xanthine dehydrogenase family protein subunit M [Burkholderiales bacterium]|nr:xanthine dehydrogenase family protein subunit M [Burkholderiales bacterium]
MKAAPFAYAKPSTVAQALELLERHGEAARVLAGGQSLIPALNMRLSSPALLVDIGALRELKAIEVKGDRLSIGALVTHAALERSPEVGRHVPLLAQAVPHVAHAAIRNRGTLGGSLALADPAAEYPAVALALDAQIVLRGAKGERRVRAQDFFKGLFETDLRPGEIVAAAEFPLAKPGDRSVFLELARRHGDYAIVGLAAWRGETRGAETRFAFLNVGPTPVLVRDADELNPTADLHNSAATKKHLARVLMERAWNNLSK